jgi:hypothetical protein
MEQITKKIDITPHKSLMPKIGRAGYSVSEAISELIDNSIDAKYEDRLLHIRIILKSDYIAVLDDGKGMDEETAAKAIKLAYSEKKNQLGEFGLGLKTSCQSLGKKFTLTTTQEDSNEEYKIIFDEDEWMKNGDWTNHLMEIKKGGDKKISFTNILIEKLRIKFYPNLVTNIKEDLSLRFAPFIQNNEIKIFVNNSVCEPYSFELTEEDKENFEFTLSNGEKIYGWRGLLKNPGGAGNKGFYGFNTFRRGRLITYYDKIGFNPHPEVRRVVGELHMDNVPVTHNKREWIKESNDYVLAEESMKKFMKPFLAKARNYETTSVIDSKLTEKMDVQLDIIAKAIKNTPELNVYATPNVIESKKTKFPVEIEKRERNDESVIQEYKEPEENRERNPKKTHLKRRYLLTINGKKFKFTHEFRDLQDTETMKQVAVSEEKGIEVFTNISFPAFIATKDRIFYATLNISEAIAEIMIKEKSESLEKINELRNLILRKTGEIMRGLEEEKKLEKIEVKIKDKRDKIKELL